MITTEKVNDKIKNNFTEEEITDIYKQIGEAAIGNLKSKMTGNIDFKATKELFKKFFNKQNPLLDINEPITEQGWTVIELASWMNQTKIIEELLLLGANVGKDYKCLHFAINKGNLKICNKFIETDPSILKLHSPQGVTPLLAAVEAGQRDIVKLLIEKHHVSLTDTDNAGKDCFIYAREKNKYELEVFLRYYSLDNKINKDDIKTTKKVIKV